MKATNKNLESLKTETRNSIKQRIIDDLLEYDTAEERTDYLEDVMQHGCQSGIVSGLIYYTDTGAFYDEHEAEIWEILEEQAESFGQGVFEMIEGFNGSETVGDLATFKNLLAWFAYEETARAIYEQDLELEF